jgi:Na+/H+ antiporter NhaD/arsenite permease-like protein
MIPALCILEAQSSRLALGAPWQYFWATGSLSVFLDNAPTYLTFATMAAAKVDASAHQFDALAEKAPGCWPPSRAGRSSWAP